MKKTDKSSVKKSKKQYAAPKLKTHGDVAKLTKHGHHHDHDHKHQPGSNLFDFHDDQH